jgi:uncharacterized glyoxalase superfamily protein PhnB
MDITIYQTSLPHDDPDAALVFWRDTLGFEVRNDVGYKGMAKGTFAGIIILSTADLDGVFERLRVSDAEVVQEPTEQPS